MAASSLLSFASTRAAVAELFGSALPEGYNIFQDNVAEAARYSDLVRRALGGEPLRPPPSGSTRAPHWPTTPGRCSPRGRRQGSLLTQLANLLPKHSA